MTNRLGYVVTIKIGIAQEILSVNWVNSNSVVPLLFEWFWLIPRETTCFGRCPHPPIFDQPGDRARPMTKRNSDQNIQDWVNNRVYIVYITTIIFIYYYYYHIFYYYYYYHYYNYIVIKYIAIKDWVMWDSPSCHSHHPSGYCLPGRGRRQKTHRSPSNLDDQTGAFRTT